jgi:hypothetical protein
MIAIPLPRLNSTSDLHHSQILTPTEAFQCFRRHFLHLRNGQAAIRPGFGRRTIRPSGRCLRGSTDPARRHFHRRIQSFQTFAAPTIAHATAKGVSGALPDGRPERLERRKPPRLANRGRQKSSPAWPTFSLRLLRSPPIRTDPIGSYATFATVHAARRPVRTSSCGLPRNMTSFSGPTTTNKTTA